MQYYSPSVSTPSHFYEAHQWLFFNKILLYYPLLLQIQNVSHCPETAFCTGIQDSSIWFQYHFSLGSSKSTHALPQWHRVISLCADSLWPMDCSQPRSSAHRILQGRISGVPRLLQGIFSPGLNLCVTPASAGVLYHLSHWEARALVRVVLIARNAAPSSFLWQIGLPRSSSDNIYSTKPLPKPSLTQPMKLVCLLLYCLHILWYQRLLLDALAETRPHLCYIWPARCLL